MLLAGPRFEMPASPTGWASSSPHLIRIVDPLGDAIAWFAPKLGASCVGYFVRAEPVSPSRDARWHEVVTRSTLIRSPDSKSSSQADDVDREGKWRFVERDPASCIMVWSFSELHAENWTLTASLDNAKLLLTLSIQNLGTRSIASGVQLRLALALPEGAGIRAVSPPENAVDEDLNGDRATLNTEGNQVEITVDTASVGCEMGSEHLEQGSGYTVVDRQVNWHAPLLKPNECHHFSIQVGLKRPSSRRSPG